MRKNNFLTTFFLSRFIFGLITVLSVSFSSNFVSAQTPTAVSVPNFIFSYNLRLGSRGEAVLRLQQILNSDPETLVSFQGHGSRGLETDYFGPATLSAVIRFQEKYRGEILLGAGLRRGTGFIGSLTRAKLNNLIAPPAPTLIITPAVS